MIKLRKPLVPPSPLDSPISVCSIKTATKWCSTVEDISEKETKHFLSSKDSVKIPHYNTHYQLPYNFSILNCPQNSDRVQLRFQSPEKCIIKPYGSYSLFQFDGSDVISVLKNSTEYSFVFFKCSLKIKPKGF